MQFAHWPDDRHVVATCKIQITATSDGEIRIYQDESEGGLYVSRFMAGSTHSLEWMLMVKAGQSPAFVVVSAGQGTISVQADLNIEPDDRVVEVARQRLTQPPEDT